VDLSGGPNDGHARGSIFNALLYDRDERSLIERVKGGKGDDSIHGNDADNRLWGKSGDDSLKGGDGEEKLYGGSGNDRLRGRDGDDWLKPGGGKDRVFGGSGDDTFVFRHVYESRPGKMDTIEPEDGHVAFKRAGRSGGDVFDLSDIDADETKSGDQDFKFDGKRGAGHLWTVEDDGNTILRGNIDDRPDSEFKLTILDGKNTHASDYEAQDFLL
jgi:serralysin